MMICVVSSDGRMDHSDGLSADRLLQQKEEEVRLLLILQHLFLSIPFLHQDRFHIFMMFVLFSYLKLLFYNMMMMTAPSSSSVVELIPFCMS